MAELAGSQTHENLKAAFAGESQANRRYLYFAKVAEAEGLEDVAANFRSTADGETGHAHGHLDYLQPVGDPITANQSARRHRTCKLRLPLRHTSTPRCIRRSRRQRATRASTTSPTGLRSWPRPRSLTPGASNRCSTALVSAMKRLVERSDIVDFTTYEDSRSTTRPGALAAKKARRLHLHENLTLLFENSDTLRYQIQEIMRAEQVVREADILHEIATYNAILGAPGDLGCVLLIGSLTRCSAVDPDRVAGSAGTAVCRSRRRLKGLCSLRPSPGWAGSHQCRSLSSVPGRRACTGRHRDRLRRSRVRANVDARARCCIHRGLGPNMSTSKTSSAGTASTDAVPAKPPKTVFPEPVQFDLTSYACPRCQTTMAAESYGPCQKLCRRTQGHPAERGNRRGRCSLRTQDERHPQRRRPQRRLRVVRLASLRLFSRPPNLRPR